jgi:hypothetical protein
MGMSARVLGREFGLTAQEMNALLKQHGYLYGEPGAYGLTEKGQQFGDEHHHDNGYGGYAYRQWETRTWNDETAASLVADIEANPVGVPDLSTAATDVSHEPDVGSDYDSQPDKYARLNTSSVNRKGLDWRTVAIVGGLAGGGVLIAPHIKPFWNDKVKPAANRMRGKLTRRDAVEVQANESPDGPTDSGNF